MMESPEIKRRKCEELPDEDHEELSHEELPDGVDLDSDEEEEYIRMTPTPDSSPEFEASENTQQPSPKAKPVQHETRLPKLLFPSHEALLQFLYRKDKTGSFSTCHWNKKNADKVYKLFNVTTSIVPTNHFLTSERYKDDTCDKILDLLERFGRTPWSQVEPRLKRYLSAFEGFENLANNFKNPKIAGPLISKFANALDEAIKELKKEGETEIKNPYSLFSHTAHLLAQLEDREEECLEEYSVIFISGLLSQLNVITERFQLIPGSLHLKLPAQKGYPRLKLPVKPDFKLAGKNKGVMLVGEVKKFGSHEKRDEEHRGRRVKVHVVTDKPQGQGDEPPTLPRDEPPTLPRDEPPTLPRDEPPTLPRDEPSTLPRDEPPTLPRDKLPPSPHTGSSTATMQDKECSISVTTTVEPIPSTSTGKTGRNLQRKSSSLPCRPLDSKEEYKVNCYLPQLFGQMLAALHWNTLQFTLCERCCTSTKKVQFGFAVEGFKLRFVKLTLYDIHNREDPTVEKLLKGDQQIKCDLALTREYNLLKRRHLEMFYQMCLCIDFLYYS